MDSTLIVGANTTVTINGNGLTLNGTKGTDVIDIAPAGGNLTLVDTTIHAGFGLFCVNAGEYCDTNDPHTSSVTLTNSTVSGSTGGIGVLGDSTADLTFSSIVDNDVGGVSSGSSGASLTGVLLSQNGALNCLGSITDRGSNLSSDDSCGFNADHSRNSVPVADLHLGTRGDHGGPTETIPLLSGSVALGTVPVGQDATFRLDATERFRSGTVRLRLSTGYDSGNQRVAALRIRP